MQASGAGAPGGVDTVADFSTINITADRTVTLDVARTYGTFNFSDTSGAQNWLVNSSGGNVMTLGVSAGSPTFNVTNTATVTAPLAGTAGLTKAGPGTLVLGGTNSYTGSTVVNGGILKLTNGPTTGPLLYMSFDNVSGSTVINDGSMGAAANGLIVGTNVSVVAGGRYGNGLQVGNGPVNSGGVFINNAVTLLNNTNNTIVNAWTVAMWVKTTTTTNGGLLYQGGNTWASGNTRFYMAGNVNDSGGPFFGGVRNSQAWEVGQTPINDGNWHFVAMTTASGNVKKIYVDGVLDAFSGTANNNGWTNNATGNQVWIGGAPNIADNNVGLNGLIDEVYIYNRALSLAELTTLQGTSSTPAPLVVLPATTALSVATGTKLDLNGVNATVTGLSGTGIIDNTLTNISGPPTPATFVVNNSSDISYPGFITNSSSLGLVSVVKNGANALTLTNVNGYGGNTFLNSGTLNINHASAIGTAGTLVINGGTIDNTSGAAITVVNNKTETWENDFTFTGTANLLFGTGQTTLGGPGTVRTVTVNANTLSVGSVNGTVGLGYGLTKQGAGILAFGPGAASTISGVLNVIGGRLQIGINDFTCGGFTGNGILENASGTTRWLFVNVPTNTVTTFTGIIRDGGGAGRQGLNKLGLGTLVITGTNNYADTTTIQNGTLRVTGTNTFIAGAFGLYNVGPNANQNGVLELIGATVNANKNSNPSIQIGAAANARGFVKLNSSTLTTVSELHIGQGSGAVGTSPYSSLTMDAGSVLSSGSYLVVGLNNDRAVLNQSGGSVNVVANVMTVGAGGTGCIGVANLSGGSFTATNAANGGTFVGENGLGILNVFGTAAVTNVFNGLFLGRTGAGSSGIVNLLGGRINVNKIIRGAGTGAFNFNGGILQASVANPTFMTGLNSAYVYGGGALIDDGGFDVTIGQQLLAPSGNGVASIPLTAGGSGYLDTPLVVIANIDGSGATAIAQIDYSVGGATSGQVTNILVTNPGNDYSTPPTVTLFGGGGTGATLGTPTLAANVSGGLTKSGAGSLTLSGGSTYTGSTVVNGGTLSLNSSTITPATSGALTVNNAALSLDVSSGTSLLASSLTFQNNATNIFSYGALSANPTFPAINVAGGVTTAGATITLNISALGLKSGQFALIKYTGAALASLANFSVVLPPGVVATLVNNTANKSIDLNVTTSPKFLTWYGTAGNAWDINTTINWKDGGVDSIYQQYTNGATVVGDAVLFDDTLTNDFVNPQPTNINLTVGLSSFPVIFDNTLPYSFAGAGSLVGGGYLVKSNTGSLTIGTSNNFTGGTLIYGGSVIITNDSALGGSAGKLTLGGGSLQVNASTTNATRAVGVTAASTISVATNVTLQLGGVITGSGALSKTDLGTISLTGSNGITGNLSVSQGTLRNNGTEVLAAVVRVGNTAGLNGVLAIPAGTFQAANNAGQFTSSLIAGSAATSAGDILLNGGTLNVMQQLGLGAGTGGYGAMTMTSGTLNCGSYIVVGFNNDRAVLNLSGGTTTISSNLMTIAAGGPLSIGVANISGGTFTSAFATSSGIMVGERGAGTLNVSGTAVINVPTNTGLTIGPVANQTGWDGTANLNGGTVTAIKVARGTGTGAAKISFNGGTLKASTANNTFMQSLDSATVYANGATFDDGGFSITVPQPLLGAAGYGVSSITLASGGSGYIDSPIVTLSGGSGSNATATATVSGGVVTAVTVTCPGSGYSLGDVLSVTVDAASGGAAVTPATANTPVLAQNISGGLTKKGAGTLNLTGANTYTNTTAVTAGSLLVGPAHQVTGPVTVSSNAAFGAMFTGPGAATVGKLTLGSVAADKTTLAFALSTGSNPTAPILQTGALTVNGTNTVRLSGTVTAGTFPLLQYAGAISFVGAATFNTNVIVPQGQTATLSNYVAGSTLYVTVVGSPGIVWTGTNSVVALTNVWNLNSATNWLAAGVPTAYQESAPPGDPVLFNDIGSGLVLLSNTASPASIQISNNTVTYAFRGTGRLSGTTGVIKQGSGTANIAVAGNDYTGNTTISNGTLQLGSATTIPDGVGTGAVILGGAGTLDINSFSETINALSGSGTVNNSGGATATLTVGNGNSSMNWNGTTTNTGAGGVTLVKVGTGSMTVGGTNFFQGTCMINGGSNTLNATASVNLIGAGEFWIAQNAGTAALTNNGGTLTLNSWLVVGRNAAAANGTLVVNGGTVQKAGANNIVVGSLGATGLLVVNGGQVLNNGQLWLGENGTANGTLQLNGGLIQATQIRNNNAVFASVANFNGGTLQASAGSTDFISGTTQAILQSGGLVLDDNGFNLTLATQPLQDFGSGGGLVKLGAGTVALNNAGNAYAGQTIVSNGIFQVNGALSGSDIAVRSGATLGGTGAITGNITVDAGGILAAGTSIGTLGITGNLALSGNVVAKVNTSASPSNDLVVVSGTLNKIGAGMLTVSNLGPALVAGNSFQLFSAPLVNGNLLVISSSPALGAGLGWTNRLAFDGTIAVVATVALNPTNITTSVSGNQLTLSWPSDHLGWILQTQTNSLSTGLSTTWFDVAGSGSSTTAVYTLNPANPTVFFRLRSP